MSEHQFKLPFVLLGFLLPALLSSAALADFGARQTGLEIGNTLRYSTLKGHVEISCSEPGSPAVATATNSYDCEKTVTLPDTMSRFMTATPIDADSVILVSLHEDGSIRTFSSAYDSTYGVSIEKANLWNSSIWRTALLASGVNHFRYVLKKGAVDVTQGTFDVQVFTQTFQCSAAKLHSYSVSDCASVKVACDRFFFENNNCQ